MYSHLRSRGAVVLEVALLVAFIGTIATLSQLKNEVAQERARAQYAAAEAVAAGGAGKEGKAEGEQEICKDGESYSTEVTIIEGQQPGARSAAKASFNETARPSDFGKFKRPCKLTFCAVDGNCYTVTVPNGGKLDEKYEGSTGLVDSKMRWEQSAKDFSTAVASGDTTKIEQARDNLKIAGDKYLDDAFDSAYGFRDQRVKVYEEILKTEKIAEGLVSAAYGEISEASTKDFDAAVAAQKQASANLMKDALGNPTTFSTLADANKTAPGFGDLSEHPDDHGAGRTQPKQETSDWGKSGITPQKGQTFPDMVVDKEVGKEVRNWGAIEETDDSRAAKQAQEQLAAAEAYRASCSSWNFWDPGCRKDTVDKARAYRDTVYANAGLKTPEEVEGRGAASGSAPAPVVAVNSAGEARVGGGTSGVGATNQDGWVTEDGTPLEDLGREEYERNLKDAKVALEKAKAAAPLCTSGWMCTGASKDNLRKAQEAVDAAEERLQEFEAAYGASPERVADAKKAEDDAKKELDAVMAGEKNGVFCNSGCIAENERKAREAYEEAKARREALEGAGYKTGGTMEGGSAEKAQERLPQEAPEQKAATPTVAEGSMPGDETEAARAARERADGLLESGKYAKNPGYLLGRLYAARDALATDASVDSVEGRREQLEADVKRYEAQLKALGVTPPQDIDISKLRPEYKEGFQLGRYAAVVDRKNDGSNSREEDEMWEREANIQAQRITSAKEAEAEAKRAQTAAEAEKRRADAARRTTTNTSSPNTPPPSSQPPNNSGPGAGAGQGQQNPLSNLLSGLQKAMGGQQKQGGAKGGSGSGGGQQNPNTTACTQWPGTTLQNGQCTCPTGQSWNGSACAQQNQCAQYPGTTLVNNQCTCPQGQNWTGAKCEDAGGTATSTLKAQLACSPQAQEPGEKIALSYSCTNASTIRADGFTITGNKMSGELEVVATTTDATDGRMKFALTCAKEGKIEEARCEVAVSKAFIVLVATPSTVESGKPTKIGWITGGMKASDDACSLKRKGTSDVLKQGRSSVYETPGITGETMYVLSCTTAAGFSKTAEVTVKVK